MLQHPQYTRNRVRQLTDRFQGRVYRQTVPLARVEVSPPVGRIGFEEGRALTYRPAKLGEQFGPLYTTFWFRVQAAVPAAWRGERVDLLWDTHSENTLWIDGRSIQGLNHSGPDQERTDATLLEQAAGGETLELYLEMACNNIFGNGGKPLPEHRSPFYLDRAELGLFDPLAWGIYHDLLVLTQLEAEQADGPADLDKTWGGKLLFELNRFANAVDEADRATWEPARQILTDLLKVRNAELTHELSAIGHAHIDTAWLWPLAETHRKCTRTFSTQTRYMDRYPEYKFACSQAYQYAVIKRENPDLYARIQAKAKAGQWIPVGGSWIEPDCNIPSGESLCRQFLFGQRFFEREFGSRCKEFWNPDVFGYNGQLPQIMQQAGITRFLTQKLSWNAFNKPMHHTFHWEGIDGSQVLAHFPPADTYNAVCTIPQMRRHVRNYKDSDRSRDAYYLFGYGDGGGGPTQTMLETLRRTRDLQGVPRAQIRTSDEFFTRLENDIDDVPVVVGELYFELHRGTYTTQARTKQGNRKSEVLLHDIEFLAAVAKRLGKADYPRQTINAMWQLVLLNQFHDILPGSSIREVYEVTERDYETVQTQGEPLRTSAADALAEGDGATPINTLSFPRAEVAERPDGSLAFVEAPAYGFGQVTRAPGKVSLSEADDQITLENDKLKAVLAADGRLLSLTHKASGREALAQPGNVLELYDDQPTNWEAWDVDPYHLETGRPCPPATACRTRATDDGLRAEVTFDRELGDGKSTMTQTVRLDAGGAHLSFHCEVDWQASQKMLKVAFPVDVRAMNATYEMQFGSVERPTHFNDALALAKYEVPGHRWADLAEHGFGVALLTESKYGYSTHQNTMRISLLRAPKNPDPVADIGHQVFSYAVYPHAGTWQTGGVVAEAMRFNTLVQWAKGSAAPRSFFEVDDANLVLDTIKLAEDSDALVLRFYEAHGGRGTAKVKINLPVSKAVTCNILEDEGETVALNDGTLELPYRPYQVLSVKVE